MDLWGATDVIVRRPQGCCYTVGTVKNSLAFCHVTRAGKITQLPCSSSEDSPTQLTSSVVMTWVGHGDQGSHGSAGRICVTPPTKALRLAQAPTNQSEGRLGVQQRPKDKGRLQPPDQLATGEDLSHSSCSSKSLYGKSHQNPRDGAEGAKGGKQKFYVAYRIDSHIFPAARTFADWRFAVESPLRNEEWLSAVWTDSLEVTLFPRGTAYQRVTYTPYLPLWDVPEGPSQPTTPRGLGWSLPADQSLSLFPWSTQPKVFP